MKALVSQLHIRLRLSRQYAGIPASYGAWWPSHVISIPNDVKERTMSPAKRYASKHAKASKRRRLNARERHAYQQREAQRAIDALHQGLHDLGYF